MSPVATATTHAIVTSADEAVDVTHSCGKDGLLSCSLGCDVQGSVENNYVYSVTLSKNFAYVYVFATHFIIN